MRLDALAVMLRYRELLRVEDIFRTTKSILDTRPIYHQTDEAIRGHVVCSFLALVLRKTLEDRIATARVKPEWGVLLRDLDRLAAMALLHSGAGVPSGMAQEWMPTRPPMYTMRVSPDTNSAIAHAEAQDAPGFTTVRIPRRASMFAAIASASLTKPPGLSSSNVSNFGSAAKFAASPSSIGPDACTVPAFSPRMACTACGMIGADARPNAIG